MGTKLQFSRAHNSQTDGQTEVVNRSLGDLLRSLAGENKASWSPALPHVEFAYNKSKSRSTNMSPFFEVVYGGNPNSPLDFVPLPVNLKLPTKNIMQLTVSTCDMLNFKLATLCGLT